MLAFERSRHGVAGFGAADSERRHADQIKFGTVHAADYANARYRVLIGDADDQEGHMVTGWLPMLGGRARNDAEWHPLEVGERVVVLSESGEVQNAVVLPAGIYSDEDPAPGAKAGLWRKRFQDGGLIEYDRDSGEWLIEGMSKITLTVGGCTLEITAQGFAFTGGTVTHNGKNIGATHKHTNVQSGAGISGPPQ